MYENLPLSHSQSLESCSMQYYLLCAWQLFTAEIKRREKKNPDYSANNKIENTKLKWPLVLAVAKTSWLHNFLTALLRTQSVCVCVCKLLVDGVYWTKKKRKRKKP